LVNMIKELLYPKKDAPAAKIEKVSEYDVVLNNPEIVSHTALDFKLPEYEGRELRPGHKIIFKVPDDFKDRVIRDVILRHRKGNTYRVDIGPDGHDPYGAYSRVELRDSKSGQWREWRDPAGYNPVKFAEPRSAGDPENEVLHDWVAMVGIITPDAARVTNEGKDDRYSVSQIHGLEMVFFPEQEGLTYNQNIYTQGTSFIDFASKNLLPQYGGGEHTAGVYKDAVVLGSYHSKDQEIHGESSLNTRVEGSRLIIKPTPGKKIVQIEVAIGDTEHRPDGNNRLGWAKLWVGIRRSSSRNIDWFIKNANVPPQGVIAGGPHIDQGLINPDDEIIIESRNDTSYIMGWRLASKD